MIHSTIQLQLHDLLNFPHVDGDCLGTFRISVLDRGACIAFMPLHDAWLLWLFF